jgi:hypothetical protein
VKYDTDDFYENPPKTPILVKTGEKIGHYTSVSAGEIK